MQQLRLTMGNEKYKFIDRLIKRIPLNSKFYNNTFCYYKYFIVLQSSTRDFISVTVHHTTNPYFDMLVYSSFNYWTNRLHFTLKRLKLSSTE